MKIDAPGAGGSTSRSATKKRIWASMKRRPVVAAAAAVAIVALAALAAGAGAMSKCYPLNTTVYADPSGDGTGTGAPDITGITVTSYEGGKTAFHITLANESEFTSDMVVRTFIDADKSSATGNGKGFEYMIQAQGTATPGGDNGSDSGDSDGSTPPGDGSGDQPGDGSGDGGGVEWVIHPKALAGAKCDGGGEAGIGLYQWNGSGWAPVEADSLSGWYGDNTLNLEINSEDIQKAVAFNFAVYAASQVTFDDAGWPVLTNVAYDWAPDTSTYSYQPFDYSAYNDPTGDGSGAGAPDITRVVVTRWHHHELNFSIEIPGTDEFSPDMLVRTYVDADANPATGDANGFDYVVQAQMTSYEIGGDSLVPITRGLARATCYQPLLFLFKWENGAWVPQDGTLFDWRYHEGLRFSIDEGDLGGASNFNFAVYAATHVSFGQNGHPNIGAASFDWAPDTGALGFPLAPESGQFIGTYTVRSTVLRSHNFGDKKRGSASKQTWRFGHDCNKWHKCTTKAVNGSTSKFKLSRSGKKAYSGHSGRRFACEAGRSASGTESVQIKATKSRWIGGAWRVVQWEGTTRVVSPGSGNPACGGPASYTAALTGTLVR
jgi:hypothetical protein